MVMKYVITVIAAYLLGSFSISITLSRSMNRDVRSQGSNNAGATNMARVFGLKFGIVTVLCDALKAAVSMLIGKWLLGDAGIMAAGIACQLGHCFPVYYGFRGGKGVSVGAAVAFAVSPWAFLAAALAFFFVAFGTKKVSLGSMSAALAMAVVAALIHVSTPRIVLAVFCAVIVIFQHRSNIGRLAVGTEPDFRLPGKEKK